MTGKVEITQRQLDLIKKGTSKASLLEGHAKGGYRNSAYNELLKIPLEDFARVLYEPDSYEVEEEYKVGDWVALIDGADFYVKGNTKIVEVHSYEQVLEGFDYVRHGENGVWGTPLNLLRHATPEEIKAEQERRVWAGIGREIGTFKAKDFVEIELELGFRIHDERQIKLAERKYSEGKVVGIYPAESFISFGGGDDD